MGRRCSKILTPDMNQVINALYLLSESTPYSLASLFILYKRATKKYLFATLRDWSGGHDMGLKKNFLGLLSRNVY